MEHEKKNFGTIEVLSRAGRCMRAAGRPALLVVALGMVLPDLILTTFMDVYGSQAVDAMRAHATGRFDELIAPAVAFLTTVVPVALLLVVLTIVSYFALVHIVVCQYRGIPLPTAFGALRQGLRFAVPRGCLQLLLIAVIVAAGHPLVIPAILAAVLSIMAPIIAVAENKGAWRSLIDAVTLRYARRTSAGAWATFASLLYLSGLLYLVAMGIAVLNERLLTLDVLTGSLRDVFQARFSTLAFGPSYASVALLSTVLEHAALATFPFVTASLYFLVAEKRELGSA